MNKLLPAGQLQHIRIFNPVTELVQITLQRKLLNMTIINMPSLLFQAILIQPGIFPYKIVFGMRKMYTLIFHLYYFFFPPHIVTLHCGCFSNTLVFY